MCKTKKINTHKYGVGSSIRCGGTMYEIKNRIVVFVSYASKNVTQKKNAKKN